MDAGGGIPAAGHAWAAGMGLWRLAGQDAGGAHVGGEGGAGVTSGGGAGVDRVRDLVCMWDELGFMSFWAKIIAGRAQIPCANGKF